MRSHSLCSATCLPIKTKPSKKAEYFMAPHETVNQQRQAFLSSATPACSGEVDETKVVLLFSRSLILKLGGSISETPMKLLLVTLSTRILSWMKNPYFFLNYTVKLKMKCL